MQHAHTTVVHTGVPCCQQLRPWLFSTSVWSCLPAQLVELRSGRRPDSDAASMRGLFDLSVFDGRAALCVYVLHWCIVSH